MYKVLVDVVGNPSYFDGVRGDATIRDLDICIGLPAYGGTYVLPANVENADNGKIFQVGWGVRPSQSISWIYADGTDSAIWLDQPDCPPVPGHRVTFRITRSNGYALYRVDDQTDGCGFFWTSSTKLGMGMDITWWGYEKNDTSSGLGPVAGNGNVNMAYMGYNTDLSGTWTWRTDLINRVDDPTCPDCMHRFFTSTDDKTYLPAIGTWAYSGDKFNVSTSY